ncbi:Yip1 member 1 [Sparganum proliferum]
MATPAFCRYMQSSCRAAPASQPQRVSIFHLDFYKSYFDVDTNQVLKRLCSSVWPFSKECSLYNSLQPTPDLYGPFWITVTLIFSVAFAGSIREYILLRDKSTLSTFNFMRVPVEEPLHHMFTDGTLIDGDRTLPSTTPLTASLSTTIEFPDSLSDLLAHI